MTDRILSTITRTVTLSDLTPVEMANIFAQWEDYKQAEFFDALADEAKSWPGCGWGIQAMYIAGKLTPRGTRVVEALWDGVPK